MGVKDTLFSVKKTLNIRGILHALERPWIMGIVNLTPDSFYNKSRVQREDDIVKRVEDMLSDGADLVDLGAYSSRPGATHISEQEEWERLQPAIKVILRNYPETLISVDTFRSSIAWKAYEEGASMINDISGGQIDDNMFKTISEIRLPYILMHMRGDPRTMNTLTTYDNLFKEMINYFESRILELKSSGVNDIIIDPGFGFSKSLDQNYELLKNFTYFEVLGYPLLVGLSRKSMIFKQLGVQPSEALNGTIALNTVSLLKRASILRVHDIKEAKEVVNLVAKLNQ
ncbi:MAG: dihydropteroate synthase [Cyclobacteriaceae bacterium]